MCIISGISILVLIIYDYLFLQLQGISRRAARGKGGGTSPALFWKSKKSALILEKKVLIASIFVLNLLFNPF